MKVLIAPWGDYESWKEVEYSYKGEKGKGRTSLLLLKRVENPDKTFIIVLDTLADKVIGNYNKYQDIRDFVEFDVCCFLLENNIDDAEIIISYGIGGFKNSKFSGFAQDFYYDVYYQLVARFLKILEGYKDEKIEVYLDITHGINLMPVLTYRAVKEICQILAYFYDVKLVVLNSDPASGEEKTENRNEEKKTKMANINMNINEIENINVFPRFLVYRGQGKILKGAEFLSNEEKKDIEAQLNELNKGFRKDFREACYFASAFMYGLPLWVLYYLPDTKALKDFLDKVHRRHREYIEIIKNDEGKKEIKRKVKFTEDFVELNKIYFLAEILQKSGFKREEKIEIDKIKEINKEIYKKYFPVESNRIDKEIDDIEKAKIENKKENEEKNGWKLYSEIKGKGVRGKSQSGHDNNEKFKRNFFAHAGFEYNSVQLKKVNGKIYLRPNDSNKENVEKLLIENLPGG